MRLRHQCANSATPWRIVKPLADNDLMGLPAKPPRVTPSRKNCGFWGYLLAPKRYRVWQNDRGTLWRNSLVCPSLAASPCRLRNPCPPNAPSNDRSETRKRRVLSPCLEGSAALLC